MKTLDFIRLNLDKVPTREKRCASVLQGTDGNFYSYGYHYPLLVKYNGKWFLNDRGYSSTTGRHIRHASAATDYKAHRVTLNAPHGLAGLFDGHKNIPTYIINERVALKARYNLLSSRAFRQKEKLAARIDELYLSFQATQTHGIVSNLLTA